MINISNARKNTMAVVDSKTGVMIGSVSCDYPKVLSGEWGHHSKGKILLINLLTNERKYVLTKDRKNYDSNWVTPQKLYKQSEGSNNPKYSGISDEFIIECAEQFKSEYNIYPSYPLLLIFHK